MSAFSYADEGGPAAPDLEQALSFLHALRVHNARWLIYPRFVSIAAPSVGTEWSVNIPGGTSWILVTSVATLVTSAVAGNRAPSLVLDDTSTVVARLPSANVQAASLTNRHGWVRGFDDAAQAANAVDFTAGLPMAPIPPNTRLRTITASLDAGDQWSAIGLYVIQIRERTWQELARYMDDLSTGVHDELFPGFPLGL